MNDLKLLPTSSPSSKAERHDSWLRILERTLSQKKVIVTYLEYLYLYLLMRTPLTRATNLYLVFHLFDGHAGKRRLRYVSQQNARVIWLDKLSGMSSLRNLFNSVVAGGTLLLPISAFMPLGKFPSQARLLGAPLPPSVLFLQPRIFPHMLSNYLNPS